MSTYKEEQTKKKEEAKKIKQKQNKQAMRVFGELITTERTHVKNMTLAKAWVEELGKQGILKGPEYTLMLKDYEELLKVSSKMLQGLEGIANRIGIEPGPGLEKVLEEIGVKELDEKISALSGEIEELYSEENVQKYFDAHASGALHDEFIKIKGRSPEDEIDRKSRKNKLDVNKIKKDVANREGLLPRGLSEKEVDEARKKEVDEARSMLMQPYSSFSIMPVQRPMRYVLLFKELQKGGVNVSDQLELIEEGVEKMNSVQRSIGENFPGRYADIKKRIHWLSKNPRTYKYLDGMCRTLAVEYEIARKTGNFSKYFEVVNEFETAYANKFGSAVGAGVQSVVRALEDLKTDLKKEGSVDALLEQKKIERKQELTELRELKEAERIKEVEHIKGKRLKEAETLIKSGGSNFVAKSEKLSEVIGAKKKSQLMNEMWKRWEEGRKSATEGGAMEPSSGYRPSEDKPAPSGQRPHVESMVDKIEKYGGKQHQKPNKHKP